MKCCVDMFQRLDRIRLGREFSTGSAQTEKVALRPPAQLSRQRHGARG